MRILPLLICILAMLSFTITARSQSASPLHVAVAGKAKPSVILIPGFTCPGKVWDETVAQLSARYTCHVITFAGFAGQPAQTDPHLGQWVAAIAAYIKTNRLERPVIIGHSIGGGMAMMLAAGYPDLVSKIVVVDALPCLSALQHPGFKADPAPDCSRFVNQYLAMSDSMLLLQQQRTIPFLCADTAMQPEIVDWSVKSDRKTMGQIYCEFTNTDLRDTLAAIQCPALILLEAPFRMYDESMQQQYARLRNKQLVYAQKGLHFIMYDDRDWYLQQIKSYLK